MKDNKEKMELSVFFKSVIDQDTASIVLCDLMMGRFGYLWARKEPACATD